MASRCLAAPSYQRRRPEQTVLYRTIAAHLPAFLARAAREDGTGGWPRFVRREFEAYLRCGILAHGVVRVRCERCGDTTVTGFSCKGRGFCPSCGGRRMSELAAHLVDHVLPDVPIRQWVFTVRPVFHRLPPLTDADIAGLLTRTYRRVRRLLSRRGRCTDAEAGSDPFAAQEPLFASAVAASLQGRVALGPRAGQPVRRLRSAADVVTTGRRSARLEGFSLHADVAVPARRRDQLERLCRYLLRPPLAGERLTESTGGQLPFLLPGWVTPRPTPIRIRSSTDMDWSGPACRTANARTHHAAPPGGGIAAAVFAR